MLIIEIIAVIFAITVHEYAHAFVAMKLGDDTAARLGRMSLNPIRHVDLFGTIILPILLILLKAPVFGWAKPVLIDYRNFKNPPRDYMLVGLAGPITNILVAIFFAAIYRISPNQIYMVFIMINIVLAVVNFIPIPPLDGSRFIAWVLPRRMWFSFIKLDRYGIFFIIVLIYIKFFNFVVWPVIIWSMRFLGVSI